MAGDEGAEKSSEADRQPSGASATVARVPGFISYASPNAETAHAICRSLEGQGISCWLAPRDVIRLLCGRR
jgi:hypothetical protein